MTAAKVVDASAFGALLFVERQAEAIADRMADSRLFAPALIFFELANICCTKVRSTPEHGEALREMLRRAQDFDIEVVPIEQVEVFDLAMRTGLTAYDASYLWLAEKLSAELITLDKQLSAAARERRLARGT